jgi:pimeloyl-ACP methyl ester carboxylesterase
MVDSDRVGLWGISQGGWLAPMAYTMDPDAISFQILVSPSGDGPAGQMMYAAERNLRDAGLDEETVETGLALRETIYAYFRHEISREEAQAAVDAHKDEPWFDLLYMGREVPEDPTTSGWYHEMRFEPREYFTQINTPVALIYGEDDPLVDVDRSIDVFQAALAEAGNTDYEIHRVPTTGHAMLDNEREVLASGVEVTPDHFSDAYARIMADFVQRTGRDD